jgi:hypothetical protein
MTIPRPFTVHYNPYTQTMEVVDNKEQIMNIVRALRSMTMKILAFYNFDLFQMIWMS